MNIGLIGGIVGSVIGLAGGLIGAYCSYKRAKSPQGRRFVVFASVALFIFLALLLVLLSLFPQYRPGIFIAYVILLPAGVTYINRRESALQRGAEANV